MFGFSFACFLSPPPRAPLFPPLPRQTHANTHVWGIFAKRINYPPEKSTLFAKKTPSTYSIFFCTPRRISSIFSFFLSSHLKIRCNWNNAAKFDFLRRFFLFYFFLLRGCCKAEVIKPQLNSYPTSYDLRVKTTEIWRI